MQKMNKRDWLIPIILLLIIAIVVWLSPEEQTLGSRIKIVYVHVAFTWAGLAGILLSGLLSIAVVWKPFAERLEKLLPLIGMTSVLIFGIGFVLSFAAAKVNWGGFDWAEPRAVAALRILSVALIVQALAYMVRNIRFRAVLYILLVISTVIIRATVEDAIHPTNPIFSSASNSFAMTVLTLTALVVLLSIWGMTVRYRMVKQKHSPAL